MSVNQVLNNNFQVRLTAIMIVSIAPLENFNAFHGFGYVMVIRIAWMEAMRWMQHAVCPETSAYLYLFAHQLLLLIAGGWKCLDGGFKCTTGKPTCINSTLLCDQHLHCQDESDENTCGRYCKHCLVALNKVRGEWLVLVAQSGHLWKIYKN